jgi:hypothetical protein
MVQAMTGIQSSPRIAPGGGALQSPASQQQRDEDFASLLAGEEAERRGNPAVQAGENRRADLEAGLAHVFNAFGFFQPGPRTGPKNANRLAAETPPANPESPPEEPKTTSSADAARAARETGELLAAPGEDGSPNHANTAQIDGSQDFAPSRDMIGGVESMPGAQRQADARSLPSRSLAPVARRVADAEGIRASGPIESCEAEDGVDQPRKPAPQIAANDGEAIDAAETSDRLTLCIGSHAVELIGRVGNLDGEEERQLIKALAALLDGHGLKLGAATLNGRLIGWNGFGRTS